MTLDKSIHILMVDDHQIIVEGYQQILDSLSPTDRSFVYETANTCDLAWEKIKNRPYDLVLLDLNFPVDTHQKIVSGEALAVKIRKEFPQVKIIILTGVSELIPLNHIIKKINPEGFLLKGETNSKEIYRCIDTLLDGNMYYSATVNRMLHSRFVNDLNLDDNDRKILEYLALGTKTKNLPNHIPLSLRSIEVRKKKLREIFDARDDETLLRNARTAGYL